MVDLKALPDETTIKEASDLEVFDINGDKVKFGSIYASEKTIVVFISMQMIRYTYLFWSFDDNRWIGHFFCGVRYEILWF